MHVVPTQNERSFPPNRYLLSIAYDRQKVSPIPVSCATLNESLNHLHPPIYLSSPFYCYRLVIRRCGYAGRLCVSRKLPHLVLLQKGELGAIGVYLLDELDQELWAQGQVEVLLELFVR